jgi:hypothetical protein
MSIDELNNLNNDVESIYKAIIEFDNEYNMKLVESDPKERYFSFVSFEKSAIIEDKIKVLNKEDKKLLLDKVNSYIMNNLSGKTTPVFRYVHQSITYLMNNKTR